MEVRAANWPLSDFSTVVALEPYLHPAIGIYDYGHRVTIEQRLVKSILTLVHPLLLVLNSLATPRVAQPVGGRSNG